MVVALTTGLASAHVPDETLNVPGEYPTIAAALEVAQEGDVVAVSPGTYYEHNLVMNRGVSLIGLGSTPDDVIIDALESDHRVVSMIESSAMLSMVTLKNGNADLSSTQYFMGGGLLLLGGDPQVDRVHILDCTAMHGGGIAMRDCEDARLTDCVIQGCQAWGLGGGLYVVDTTGPQIQNSLIYENKANVAGGAWYIARNILFMDGCTVVGNQAPEGAEGAAFGVEGIVGSQLDNIISHGNAPTDMPHQDVQAEDLFATDYVGRPYNRCTIRFEPGWPGFLDYQLTSPSYDNLEEDPVFCGLHPDFATIFGVADTSPCLPENNSCGELIGAYGQACQTTGVPEATPQVTQLHRAHPNPFNPATTINYELARGGRVNLAIYNLAGRRVATLVSEVRAAGAHSVKWNGRDDSGRGAASGVYLCRLLADGTTSSIRLTLVK